LTFPYIPYTVAVAAAVCVDDSWPATERNNGKIELDPISTEERLRQLLAVSGCNGTEFYYVFFIEQRNFTTEERQRNDGNWA